jgi:phosphohistidine phosphatase SixA
MPAIEIENKFRRTCTNARLPMLIYLIQHAEAKEENEDPDRSLSEKGTRSIRETSSHFYRNNVRVDQILHSSKLRAKQTAEIIAERLRRQITRLSRRPTDCLPWIVPEYGMTGSNI